MIVVWQPRIDDYYKLFQEQNPWHSTGEVPSLLAPPTERPLARTLWKRLVRGELRRHQVILGPRRVGKTTVLYQTVKHLMANGVTPERIWWFRMDHPLLIETSLGNLVKRVLETGQASVERPLFLMLDELVYANEWDLWLKTFHDDRWPVRVVATSSSTTMLRQQRHESGVGRWEEQYLLPCCVDEGLELLGQTQDTTAHDTLAATLSALPRGQRADPELENRRHFHVFVGGFPELLTELRADDLEGHVLESQRVLRGDAVERAVYKDIPQTWGVENPVMLERLLYVLAGQVTGVLSPSSICGRLGITQPTLDRYLSYLQQAYLVFALTNYSGTESAVQRRGRKLYFVDSAVRNAALHRGLAPLGDPVEQGTLLENLVASTVNTLAVHSGVRLHHWREGDLEVDLVYDDPRQALAFEIASSTGHSRRGLTALIERHEQFRGHSYLVAPQAAVIHADRAASGIGMLPLDTFLLAVGAQAYRAVTARLGVSE